MDGRHKDAKQRGTSSWARPGKRETIDMGEVMYPKVLKRENVSSGQEVEWAARVYSDRIVVYLPYYDGNGIARSASFTFCEPVLISKVNAAIERGEESYVWERIVSKINFTFIR
jgi:hypothetical protein